MTAAELLPSLSGPLLAGFVIVAVVFVTRIVRHVRRHRPLANRRFMRRYRATTPTTPFIRRPHPAGTGLDPALPASLPHNRRVA